MTVMRHVGPHPSDGTFNINILQLSLSDGLETRCFSKPAWCPNRVEVGGIGGSWLLAATSLG